MFAKSYMYDDKWTRWIDDSFIWSLQYYANTKNRSLSADDIKILLEVQNRLEQDTGAVFNIMDIRYRFELAHCRYRTWKDIINRLDVKYDVVKNLVIATDDTWEEICSEHILGQFYRDMNEHQWSSLQEIFGPNNAREFGQTQRTPRRISDKVYTAEELLHEGVALQAEVDDVKHIRRIVRDPKNRKYMGQTSLMPLEEVLPLPGNPALGIEDFLNGTPEERFHVDNDSRAKRRLDF